MKNILSQANREVLAQFAWSNVLLAFDYDGTLAPIVENPERAVMRSTTRELLQQASELYPTIVISGRAQSDALKLLGRVGLREVVGNHGLEPGHGTQRMTQQVRRWKAILEPELAPFKGVWIEDKAFSLAVHYRKSRAKKDARRAIAQVLSGLQGIRVVGGKQVVNVVPRGAPHKGIALERERERLHCDTAIYVGDDETDEDVFTLNRPGLLTIRVGAKRGSSATFCLARQNQVDELLGTLVDLRRKRVERKQAVR